MTGYRSGFVAGDPELIAALKQFRPNVGTAPQEFVQRASVVAWSDEEHVERARRSYARKRELFLDLFARTGLRNAGGPATMYLWSRCPTARRRRRFAAQLLEHGVLVAPGSFLGAVGRGLRPLRPRPDRGGVRASRRDPGAMRLLTQPPGPRESTWSSREIDEMWERAARRRVEEAIALLDAGEIRVAEPGRRRLASSTSGSRRRSCSTSGSARSSRWTSAASTSSTRSRSSRDYADRGVRVVPPGVARYGVVPLRGLRPDAGLRQHRRLGRAADDGRHLGDGRLVRADRRRRAPRGRRRHRRRARAAAGARR